MRHHENRFDARPQPAVHERHLQLVLIIRDRPDAAQQNRGRARGRIIHQQPVEGIHLHVGIDADHFAQHFHALLDGEERLLALVPQNRNDQPVEQPRAALDQIEMPVGDRVERSRIDGDHVRRLGRQCLNSSGKRASAAQRFRAAPCRANARVPPESKSRKGGRAWPARPAAARTVRGPGSPGPGIPARTGARLSCVDAGTQRRTLSRQSRKFRFQKGGRACRPVRRQPARYGGLVPPAPAFPQGRVRA